MTIPLIDPRVGLAIRPFLNSTVKIEREGEKGEATWKTVVSEVKCFRQFDRGRFAASNNDGHAIKSWTVIIIKDPDWTVAAGDRLTDVDTREKLYVADSNASDPNLPIIQLTCTEKK